MELPLARGGPKFNALLVNQELLLNLDAAYVRSRKVGMLLCRSELCARICERLFPSVPLAVLPFTTIAPPPTFEGSPRVFVHLGGGSLYKNTAAVLGAWVRHPQWPVLYVTCRGLCLHREVRAKLAELRRANRLLSQTDGLAQSGEDAPQEDNPRFPYWRRPHTKEIINFLTGEDAPQ